MKIETITVTPFSQNCRVVYDPETKLASIFDPGGDTERLLKFLSSNNLVLEAIFLTHSHIDHVGGVQKILDHFSGVGKVIPLYGHKDETFLRENVQNAAAYFGLDSASFDDCPEPSNLLEGGENLIIAGKKVSVLFTPGHSPGHLSFYFEDGVESPILISGDALFKEGIGRTDLPGGDLNTLLASIKNQLFTLPPHTKVLSGHGSETTIKHEMEHNPYLS